MVRSSRRAPNQSSKLGSSEPAATISIAQPSSVAAAPTPTEPLVPTARSRTNASASTIRTIPIVNTNSARPRRVRLECRSPAHAIKLSASMTYSRGSSQDSSVPPASRLRLRYASGDISGCFSSEKKATRLTPAMMAAAVYCTMATFRAAAGARVDETVVIITQLPAAHAISAT